MLHVSLFEGWNSCDLPAAKVKSSEPHSIVLNLWLHKNILRGEGHFEHIWNIYTNLCPYFHSFMDNHLSGILGNAALNWKYTIWIRKHMKVHWGPSLEGVQVGCVRTSTYLQFLEFDQQWNRSVHVWNESSELTLESSRNKTATIPWSTAVRVRILLECIWTLSLHFCMKPPWALWCFHVLIPFSEFL